MRVVALRKLLVLLTGLAFLLGMAAQAGPSARAIVSAATSTAESVGCAAMSLGVAESPAFANQPCDCISLDCAAQVGCICAPALPAEPTAISFQFARARLSYQPHRATAPAERSIEPNLQAPIAA